MAIQADKTNTAVIATMFAVGAAAMLGGSAAIVALARGEVRAAKEQNSGYADLSRIQELREQQAEQLSGAKLPIDKARSLVLQQIQHDSNAASPFTPPPVEAAGGASEVAEAADSGSAGGDGAAAPPSATAAATAEPSEENAAPDEATAPAPTEEGH